ncbi:MAG: hypothetical protein ACLQK4_10220 [Acidimicrobiales bacterium]
MQRHLRIGPRFGFPGTGEIAHLFRQAVRGAVHLFFFESVRLVARMDTNTIRRLWSVVSATTEPVLTGRAWQAEFTTMTVIAAATVLPLLCVAAIQAVARQDAGGLFRTAFVRVPLALLFTAVAVELVSLGLQATDEACGSLIDSAGHPLHALFAHMEMVLGGSSPTLLAANFLFLLLAGCLAFLVWIELAVRSAAIAVATLFLPLALAGSALPATAHWARRLGETLTALVLSKLAIVAVLTLAVGTFGEPSDGLASIVEGITLLGLAAVAPLALARILPMVEAGAVAHLDGLGRHSVRAVVSAASAPNAWMTTSGGRAASEGRGVATAGSAPSGAGALPVGPRPETPPPANPSPVPPPAGPPRQGPPPPAAPAGRGTNAQGGSP